MNEEGGEGGREEEMRVGMRRGWRRMRKEMGGWKRTEEEKSIVI